LSGAAAPDGRLQPSPVGGSPINLRDGVADHDRMSSRMGSPFEWMTA
jgi:hypothetical protein